MGFLRRYSVKQVIQIGNMGARAESSFARLDSREPALSLSKGRLSPHQPDYPERGFGR